MRTMKDSGVEWIGKIPQGWNVQRGKYTFSVLSGFAFPSSDFSTSEGIPLVRIRDITSGVTETFFKGEYSEEFLVDDGDLLIGMDGDFGIRVWDNGQALLNQRCCKIIANKDNSLKYLFYVLPYELKRINDLAFFTTVKHLSTEDLALVNIPLPSGEEQRRIADYLDTKCTEIDALIAAKEKTNALLKERRQSIIYEAVTKGLNPDAPMKDSGIEWIGQIPENWGSAALKRVATPSTGMTPSKANSQYWEGDIPWFSSKDIKADYLFDSEDHISQQAVEECGLTVHAENSVVFCARSGILRHTFPVSVLKCKGTINQDLRVLATSAAIDPEFLMYYLRGMNNTIVTLYQKVGATVESIEMEWLLYLPVALPPVEEQKQIADYIVARCNEIDGQIAANEVSVTKLKEYRQSIIYEAVTGKIEV